MAAARELRPIDEARSIYNQYQTLKKDLKATGSQPVLDRLQKMLSELREKNENLLLIAILHACTFDKTDALKTVLIEAGITKTFYEYYRNPSSPISLEGITIDDIELLSQHKRSFLGVPPVLSALKDYIKTQEEQNFVLLWETLHNTLCFIPPQLFPIIMSYVSERWRTDSFYRSLLVRSEPVEEKETKPFIFTCQLKIQHTYKDDEYFDDKDVTFTITMDNRIHYQIGREEKEINRKTLIKDSFTSKLGEQIANYNWPFVKELFSVTPQQVQNLRNIARILIHLGKLGDQNAREGLNIDFPRLHRIGVFRVDPVFHSIADPSRFFDRLDEIEANTVIENISHVKADQRSYLFFTEYSPKMASNIQGIIEELKMIPPDVLKKLHKEVERPSFFRDQIRDHFGTPIHRLWASTHDESINRLSEFTSAAYRNS